MSPASRSTSRARLATLGLGVVSLAIALLGAEVALRALSDPPAAPDFRRARTGFRWRDPAPYVVYRATPNADVWLREPGWVVQQAGSNADPEAHVVTDSHGFRFAGDLLRPKRANELRLFLLGGSTTVLGVRNETTICGRLEARLRARLGPSLEPLCISAGVLSGVSDQSLAVLVHSVMDLEPDVVVALEGYNDVVARTRYDPRLGYPADWMVWEERRTRSIEDARGLREAIAGFPLWRIALARSRLATRLWPDLELDVQIVHRLEESHPERPSVEAIAEHLLGNWRKMREISEAVGARFHAVLQPIRPGDRDRGPEAAYYDLLGDRIAAARRGGSPYASFDRRLDDSPEVFYDAVHTRDSAHDRIAGWLLDLLAEAGSLPAAAPRVRSGADAHGGATPAVRLESDRSAS